MSYYARRLNLKSNFDEDLSLDLCNAIDEPNYTLAQKLINNPQVNINIQDENGLTPLLWCCLNGDTPKHSQTFTRA